MAEETIIKRDEAMAMTTEQGDMMVMTNPGGGPS